MRAVERAQRLAAELDRPSEWVATQIYFLPIDTDNLVGRASRHPSPPYSVVEFVRESHGEFVNGNQVAPTPLFGPDESSRPVGPSVRIWYTTQP